MCASQLFLEAGHLSELGGHVLRCSKQAGFIFNFIQSMCVQSLPVIFRGDLMDEFGGDVQGLTNGFLYLNARLF